MRERERKKEEVKGRDLERRDGEAKRESGETTERERERMK